MENLVCITSYQDVPRAELAKIVLAAEGIRSSLSNTVLLTWFWHYGVAVGGVKLIVTSSDVEQAREILRPSQDAQDRSTTQRECAGCREPLPTDWEICWRCGKARDGSSPPDSEPMEGLRDAKDGIGLLLIIAMLVAAIFTFTINPAAWPVFAILALAYAMYFWAQAEREIGDRPEPKEIDPDPTPPESNWQAEIVQSVIRRAWHATVIGYLAFPPLLIYALMLIKRLRGKHLKMDPLSRRRNYACWILNPIVIALLCFVIWAVLYRLSVRHFMACCSTCRSCITALGSTPRPGNRCCSITP